MKHNRRSTDRRQGKNNTSYPWNGPERRGTGRRPTWEMAVLPLESRILYHGAGDFEPDIDMPYVFDVAATNETLDAQAGATGGTKIPVAGGVPILHSRPSATAKLIIDFDGDPETDWGNYFVPTTPAYDQDGDPSTFNTAELASINEIFLRVAEKYSPFNVDVTTADSGTYLNKQSVKVIVGGSGSWLGSVAGGISFIGSFYNMTDNIAYVFPANLSNGYAKYTAEATAHEAGHAFGLQHQGQYNGTTLVQEYNPGNSLIAPIMGNSYYAARGLWWSGTPSNNSSATQADQTILSNASNAFGYRTDDYGGTTGTATVLTLSSNSFSAAGVIERNTDADYFSFTTAGSATLTLNLSVAQYGAMLDGSLFVYNSSGTLVGSADTATLGESLTLTLGGAGTYYVSVASHGGYGDIGQYTLAGSIVAAQNPEPPAVVADPSGLTVTPVSAGEIVLGWTDNSNNETGFVIQRSTDNGVTWTTLTTTGANATSYHDTTVGGGSTYRYRVQAFNGSTSSSYTAGVSGLTVPSAPTSPVATANSSTQITLTWTDVAGETSYTIERSLDGSTWTQIGTTGANVTSYVDYPLTAGTSYSYRIRALDATGPSAYSSYATAVTIPVAPVTIGAVANSASQITVSWTDVSGETSFLVERSANGTSGWAQIGTTSAGVTAFVDTSRSAGTRYYYRVRAANAAGSSAYTSVANALTLPAAPGVPVPTVISATQISVSWTAVTGASSYVLERSTDNANWSALTTTSMTTVGDMTVAAGTMYYYRVRAVNASGSSAFGSSAGARTIPDAPASITATANSATKITVEWSAVTGASAYYIERSANGMTGWVPVAAGVTDTSYIDEALAVGTPYYYRVGATNASGASAYSATANATTLELPTAVADPAFLTATAVGATRVHLSWQDNSANEDGFILQRSADGGANWDTITATDPDVAEYEDAGLSGGTRYQYRVQAYSGMVLSEFAGTVSATTSPNAPATLTLSGTATTGITVTWTMSTGATAYEIERSANGTSGWTAVATTGGDVGSYINVGLTAGTRYFYRVRAANASGASEYTAVGSAMTLPAAPVTVAVKAYTAGRLSVGWTAVSGAAGYEVQRSTTGTSGWLTIATTAADATGVEDQGLADGLQFFYRVRATNESGVSAFTGAASGLTLPGSPSTPNVTMISASQIRVEWLSVVGASGYVVERTADGTNWSAVSITLDASATSYTDDGLAPNTKYTYRVRTTNASGDSEPSLTGSAVTAQAIPNAPAGLQVLPLTSTSVQLLWEDRSGNEAGFKVEFSTDGKTWRLAGNIPANNTTVKITGLAAGANYWFRVSAYNQLGFSAPTNSVSTKSAMSPAVRALSADIAPAKIVLDIRKVKTTYPGLSKALTPEGATGLKVSAYSTSAVQLTWTDNSDTELGFRIEYSLNGRNWLLAGYVKADQTGCRVTGLQKGKAYTFRVSSYNLAGVTTHSATAKAATPRVAPTGSHAKPSYQDDQDTVLNVLNVKTAAPGLPATLKVA